MTQTINQTIDIRSFQDEDREAIVAYSNIGRPPHRHRTVAGWAHWDSISPREQVALRLVVGTPAVAYLNVVDRNTSVSKLKDVCSLDLRVAPDSRRQGIGGALYDRALAFVRERGAKRIMALAELHRPDEPAIAFLTKRGFVETERDQPSSLDLSRFDAAPFAPTVQRVEAGGVRLFPYGEMPDTEETRRRLYALFLPLDEDVPQRDSQRRDSVPFEQWGRFIVDHPQFRSDLLWLAEKDGGWIGISFMQPRRDGAAVRQFLTGVLAPYRGQGIATALKAKAYVAAQALGYPIVVTDNHELNAAMLAVNKKFGFVPEAPEVTYYKTLVEENPYADGMEHQSNH